MQGLFFTICLLITSPFGMIAGILSEMNRALPMALNIALLILCCYFVILIERFENRQKN